MEHLETNAQLLQEKLNNYRKYLRDNCDGSEQALKKLDELDKYGLQEFIVFGVSTLIPLYKTGQIQVAITKTKEHFCLSDNPEVLGKVGRYYQFLCDFLQQPV